MYLTLSSHALKLSTCFVGSPETPGKTQITIFGAPLNIYLVSHFQSHLILFITTQYNLPVFSVSVLRIWQNTEIFIYVFIETKS